VVAEEESAPRCKTLGLEDLQLALSIRNWLLRQLNANDALDGVTVTVKMAVTDHGPKMVAKELRRLADYLERTGEVPGWNFPHRGGRFKRSRHEPTDVVGSPS
jgi:hypothetical protein